MRLDPRRIIVHAALRALVRQGRAQSVAEFVRERRTDPEPFTPPTGRAARGVTVSESTTADDVPVYELSPSGAASRRRVVYLHGGAYIREIGSFQWAFVFELVRRAGVTVVVPIYALAPGRTASRTVPEMAAVVRDEIATHGVDSVVVMGDSAGGGLAVAVAQQLRDEGSGGPGRLILLSPWLDVTMADAEQEVIERHDLMLTRASLTESGLLYAGELDPRDWRVSPLHGDVSGLPPMHVFTGDHDVLVTDSRALERRVHESGGLIEYVEEDAMQHVYAIYPVLPESRSARRRIRELLTLV